MKDSPIVLLLLFCFISYAAESKASVPIAIDLTASDSIPPVEKRKPKDIELLHLANQNIIDYKSSGGKDSIYLVFFKNHVNEVMNMEVRNDSLLVKTLYDFGENVYPSQIGTCLKYAEQARNILLEMDNADSLLLAIVYNNMGLFTKKLGFYKEAEKNYDKGLAIVEKTRSKNDTTYAYILLSRGVLLYNQGFYQQALDDYDRAIQNYKAFQDSSSQSGLASAYYSAGQILRAQGDLYKAKDYLIRAFELRKSLNENQYIDDSYYAFGRLYRELGQYENALSYLDSAQVIREGSVNNTAILLAKLANIYSTKAQIYDSKGEHTTALEYFKRALDTRLKATDKDKYNPELYLGMGYNQVGYAYLQLKEYESAYKSLVKGKRHRLKVLGSKHPNLALSYMYLSECAFNQGAFSKSISFSDSALVVLNYDTVDQLEEVTDPLKLLGVLKDRASYFYVEYQRTQNDLLLFTAETIFNDCLLTLEYINNTYYDENSKLKLIDDAFDIYESILLVKSDLRNLYPDQEEKYIEEMFILCEQSKDFLLRKTFNQNDPRHISGVPDSLLNKERKINHKLNKIEISYDTLKIKDDPNLKDKLLKVKNKRFIWREKKRKLEEKFKLEYTSYYELKHRADIIALEELQNELLEPQQALIEYFIGDSNVFLFIILQKRIEIVKIDKRFPLDDWINNLQRAILALSERGSKYDTATEEYIFYASQLYEKIFSPVSSYLADYSHISKLVIIPGGRLGYIPFDALLTDKPDDNEFKTFPYLLYDYQISTAPSATVWKEMKEINHKGKKRKPFLGVAPSFPLDKDKNTSSDTDEKKETPLYNNKAEVKALQYIIGGDILLKHTATKQAMVNIAPNYQIVHLTTHGYLNDETGDYSYLAFTELKSAEDDGRLYNREIYNLRLNADMVVLSACETGLGDLKRGEGIISLSRGFTYAGAKSIVTTLWSIGDEPTPNFMELFYHNLKEGKPKDEALQLAKIQWLDQKAKPEPIYWAAFVPIGDMEPLTIEKDWSMWLKGFLFLGLLALLIFSYRKFF